MSSTRIFSNLSQLPDFHKNIDDPHCSEKLGHKLPPKTGKTECFFGGGWLVSEIAIIDDYYAPKPIKASA